MRLLQYAETGSFIKPVQSCSISIDDPGESQVRNWTSGSGMVILFQHEMRKAARPLENLYSQGWKDRVVTELLSQLNAVNVLTGYETENWRWMSIVPRVSGDSYSVVATHGEDGQRATSHANLAKALAAWICGCDISTG